MAMLVFLGLNELRLEVPDGDLTQLVLGVAEGRVTKAEVAVFVRRHAARRKE
jgi:prophage maintenance system killer protein